VVGKTLVIMAGGIAACSIWTIPLAVVIIQAIDAGRSSSSASPRLRKQSNSA